MNNDANVRRTALINALAQAAMRDEDADGFLVTHGGTEALSKREIEFLQECLQVRRAWRGDVTPAEEFVVQVVNDYVNDALTPELAQDRLEDFREYFVETLTDAQMMVNRYGPYLAKLKAVEARADQIRLR